MRLFVAIDLPQDLKENLESICCGLPGAKWVAPPQMHLTLRFLGEVDGGELPDIKDALSLVSGIPFRLRISSVGCFSSRGQPRVVWTGVEKNQELLKLKKKIDSALLKEAAVEPDRRNYSPHITLARLKDTSAQRVANYLSEYALLGTDPIAVDGFTLYSSFLNQQGARHEVVQRYSLYENE